MRAIIHVMLWFYAKVAVAVGVVVGVVVLISALGLAASIIVLRRQRKMQRGAGLSEQQLRSFTSMPVVRELSRACTPPYLGSCCDTGGLRSISAGQTL